MTSTEVSAIAHVSLRQLQWWDERRIVSPRGEDHRRVYLPEEVLEVLTVASLRRKGLSLRKIRRVLRLIWRQMGNRLSNAWSGQSRLYLLTDGHSAYLEECPERIVDLITDA